MEIYDIDTENILTTIKTTFGSIMLSGKSCRKVSEVGTTSPVDLKMAKRIHLEKHFNNTKETYMCNLCGYCGTKDQMDIHVEEHIVN